MWDQDQETAIQSPSGGTKITWGGPPLAAKPARNRWRFELVCAPAELDSELARLAELGAVAGRRTDAGAVAFDPDGNEFTLRA